MTRQTLDRRCKIWLLVLVCTIAIAATDDSWAMALGCPINSELSIVAVDDDDLDDHPVDITIRGSCMRQPTDCLESVELKDDHCLRCIPRGPPADRWNGQGLSSRFSPRAVDAPIVFVLFTVATRLRPSLEATSLHRRRYHFAANHLEGSCHRSHRDRGYDASVRLRVAADPLHQARAVSPPSLRRRARKPQPRRRTAVSGLVALNREA